MNKQLPILALAALASCALSPQAGPAPAGDAAAPQQAQSHAPRVGPARSKQAQTEQAQPEQPQPRPAAETAIPRPIDASTLRPPAQSTGGLGADELALWRSADFQRRFAESYLAETDIEPRVTAAERDVMLEVMQQIEADKLDEAAKLLDGQRGDGKNALFDFTLANIWFQQGQLDLAAAAYELAVGKFPKFRRAWQNLGLIRVRKNDFEGALPALRVVIELGGGNSDTWGLLGYANAALDQQLAAESAFRMAALLQPDAIDWKVGLARSLFKQERFADAAALCKALVAEHPERADFWLLHGNAMVGLNQPLAAAEDFEMVDRLGRATADSLTLLGDIYVNGELYDLAVDAYLRAMRQNPQTGRDRAIRAAKVLCARGALAQVEQLLAAIDEDPAGIEEQQQKDLLKLRARVAVAKGATGDEVKVLQQIVALDPLDGEALLLLGQHHARENEPERALLCYERAANIDGFEADAKVRQAQLLVSQHRYAEALPLLRRAQTLKPRDNIQQYLEQVERVAQGR